MIRNADDPLQLPPVAHAQLVVGVLEVMHDGAAQTPGPPPRGRPGSQHRVAAGIYECIREMYGTPWEGIYSTQARGREINESGVFL